MKRKKQEKCKFVTKAKNSLTICIRFGKYSVFFQRINNIDINDNYNIL